MVQHVIIVLWHYLKLQTSGEGRTLALHTTNLGSVPNIIFGPWILQGVISSVEPGE